MALTQTMAAFNDALKNCRDHFDRTIDRAEHILENRRNEHRRIIERSERSVAELESQLELYDALERSRDAARIRMELAAAIEQHQAVVDAADRQLAEGIRDYIRSFVAGGIVMEASFNAASSALSTSR